MYDTGAGYNGKMFSMVAKNLVWDVKFLWEQEILKDKNLIVMQSEKMELKLFQLTLGSKTLVDAVSECIRYWVSNCDKAHMGIGSLVGPNIFVKNLWMEYSTNFKRT